MHFAKETLALLDQVNQLYPGSIVLRGDGENTGVLKHDQVSTSMLGPRMAIEITDLTAPDVLATDELLHIMLSLNGYPQLFFQLAVENDESLTEQMMVMVTYLYQPVIHSIIYREQVKHGLLTEQVVQAYLRGVEEILDPEAGDDMTQAALRLMVLLDAKVFLAAVGAEIEEKGLESRYPLAWRAAEKLYRKMDSDHIKDPFTMHRAIEAVFKGFDEQMFVWKLPLLNAQEFVTVTPVLSQRQLRLKVNQVFDIKHVPFTVRDSNQAAYVGLSKADQQNSFVLPTPKGEQEEFFLAFYQMTVQDLFSQLKQPYTVREAKA